MYTEPQQPAAAASTHPGDPSSVGGQAVVKGGKGMWSYTYKHGDRPLDGYTVQRAAGRGGFGEVYYAVSDAGREVALKSITGFEQIELRGISQCMNLKSPHLVTIFDVRQNAEGRWFVLMEYVAGPNLRELLDQSPAGLGTQKAAFFLREIAKGLSYLHDCGIVHRDLKPANIFFENGYAKIGDYGLSKAIEPTHHSGQTVTVGTVHYMAPEVGVGKYDRSIDIYALGALLYEMLTGMVPFVGASPSEILIKHLSAEADCSGIAEPFCSAVKKAMAKDPANRFQTVQEMVEAVFGAEHVRNSVSQFSPTDLSVVAGRVAARLAPAGSPALAGRGQSIPIPPPAAPGAGSSVTNPNGGLGVLRPIPTPPPLPGGAWAAGWITGQALNGGRKIRRAINGPSRAALSDAPALPTPDPLSLKQRFPLALMCVVVVSFAAILFAGPRGEEVMWLHTLLSLSGASVAIALMACHWLPRPISGKGWGDRFALAAGGALGAVAVSGPIWLGSYEARTNLRAMFLATLVAFAFANPRRWTRPNRLSRINFGTIVWAGFIAFIATMVCDGNGVLGVALVGGTALVVQLLAPWDEIAATRRLEAGATDADDDLDDDDDDDDDEEDEEDDEAESSPATHPGAAAAAAMPAGFAAHARPAYLAGAPAVAPAFVRQYPVPRPLLIAFFFVTLASACLGTLLIVIAGATRMSSSDFAGFWAIALVLFSIAIFCFRRMRRRSFDSWLTYLILPAVRCVCLAVVLACWAIAGLGNVGSSDEEACVIAIFIFIVFWALTWTGPWLWRMAIPPAPGSPLSNGSAPFGPPPVPTSPVQVMPLSPMAAGVAIAGAVHTAGDAVRGAVDNVRQTVQHEFGTHAQRAEETRARSSRRMEKAAERAARPGIVTRFIGFVGSILLMAGFATLLLVSFDVPTLFSLGVPDPVTPREFQRMFGGVQDWPALLRSIMNVAGGGLVLGGLVAALVARRRAGGIHLIRTLIGVLGIVFALAPLQSEIVRLRPWERLSQIPGPSRPGWPMVHALLDCLQSPVTIASMSVFVVALVVLAWPARIQRPATGPVTTGKVAA